MFLLALLAPSPWPAATGESGPPRGRFAELHSCELFAGGCVVSSEADVEGNYLLRVWQFDEGNFHGAPLRGLTVALLEKGGDNLAVAATRADDAVVYLPPGLSATQKSALLDWTREQTAAKIDDSRVRTAAQQAEIGPDNVRFSAGNDIAFTGAPPVNCDVGGCGEMLWYEPRSAASSFVVDQLGQSRIVEPLLSLKWMDHGRRTLFVGRFGDPETSPAPLCGAAQTASL